MSELIDNAVSAQRVLLRFESLGGDMETPTINAHRERYGNSNPEVLAVVQSAFAFLRSSPNLADELAGRGFGGDLEDLDIHERFFAQTLQATVQYLVEQTPRFPPFGAKEPQAQGDSHE